MSDQTAERSFFDKLFLTGEEPNRLRAGWRVAIYIVALIIAFVGMSLAFAVVLAILAAVGLVPTSFFETLLASAGVVDSPVAIVSSVATVVAVTLVTWLARRFIDRRSFASLGLQLDRQTGPDLAFGFLLGGLLMGLIFAVEAAAGWLRVEEFAWQSASTGEVLAGILLPFIAFVSVAWWEELYTRGYLLQNIAEGSSVIVGLVISSLIFGITHANNPNSGLIPVIGIFLAGFFLAAGWLFTRRLWLPIGLHLGWNFFQGTVFGFPVSGTDSFALIRTAIDGPVALTGGAFGPEAGLLGWAMLVLGTVLMWLYGRLWSAEAESESAIVSEGT